MQEIVLTPLRAQRFTVQLAQQDCEFRLVQRTTGLYLDLSVNGTPCLHGIHCGNLNRLVRYWHLPFSCELFFVDTEGSENPHWQGLGTRWRLYCIPGGNAA